jgi:hypothetical protein
MGKILDPNSGGPEPSAKLGKSGALYPAEFLYDRSWDNTCPVRKRILPQKSFIHGQFIFGAGNLGYGMMPQAPRDWVKRRAWRPFCHGESKPSLFRVPVGGDDDERSFRRSRRVRPSRPRIRIDKQDICLAGLCCVQQCANQAN